MQDTLMPASKQASRVLLLARVLFSLIFVSFRLLDFSRSNNGIGGGGGNGAMRGTLEDSDLPVPPPPQWGIDVVQQHENPSVISNNNHNNNNSSNNNSSNKSKNSSKNKAV
uniref:Uncharacterized protein n=1 Tax=Lygus hesperus TaxID=30085 RepID=A0A0A9VSI0_LYGHE